MTLIHPAVAYNRPYSPGHRVNSHGLIYYFPQSELSDWKVSQSNEFSFLSCFGYLFGYVYILLAHDRNNSDFCFFMDRM